SLRELRLRTERHQAPELNAKPRLRTQLENSLPFSPTSAQRRVITEITADLQKKQPMQRLLQGDVGSGKTLVATMALLQAVENGYQAAFMVPTELLAEQHFRNLQMGFDALGVRILMLGASMKAADKTAVRLQMSLGEVDIVVGTHALFQDEVCFKRLGLIVVDEQHRFGVHQRLALREKGVAGNCVPHQLIMTATPIPRTLAMTAYADLDLSTIDELPPGRQVIDTVVIADTRRAEVVAKIREACAAGRQAYWVCSLVEESEVLQCQAAEETAICLAEMMPEVNVGLVHGRQKGQEKESIMTAFRHGEINLLVATTVIEVGVDVPNASLMVIENAERFGLAQLHQLRGRVGRGDVKSACVMLYHGPLSRLARSRLDIMRKSNDGFEIAQRDLDLRGPGDVLGARQSGLAQLKIADLTRDQALFPAVEQGAQLILGDYAERVPLLVQRWLRGGEQYGHV
ncbi:MAG: ATP-dependent DNA helicase RecG, partial [Gammaproteobacteria bacterium]|nr:ATP-dependent DNA helicase RecG [Gammaproteobacteria bacterium]